MNDGDFVPFSFDAEGGGGRGGGGGDEGGGGGGVVKEIKMLDACEAPWLQYQVPADMSMPPLLRLHTHAKHKVLIE